MKEIIALWANTLARSLTVVVECTSELYSVIMGEYFTMEGLSSLEDALAELEDK